VQKPYFEKEEESANKTINSKGFSTLRKRVRTKINKETSTKGDLKDAWRKEKRVVQVKQKNPRGKGLNGRPVSGKGGVCSLKKDPSISREMKPSPKKREHLERRKSGDERRRNGVRIEGGGLH